MLWGSVRGEAGLGTLGDRVHRCGAAGGVEEGRCEQGL